jgi:hypothetical protein
MDDSVAVLHAVVSGKCVLLLVGGAHVTGQSKETLCQGCQLYAPAAFTPGNIPGTHLCWRMSQPQGHSAAGRIMSMKNSNHTIGNRSRDYLK